MNRTQMTAHVDVFLDEAGLPTAATAQSTFLVSPTQLFALLRAVERYPDRVPMIHRVSRHDNQATVQLRFKLALFSAKFEFTAEIIEETDRLFELRWISGEPRGLRLRQEIRESTEGTTLRTHIEFDIHSLGWLVKFFLRHHPEIQFGVFSGSVLAIQHSLRAALRVPR